VIYRDIEFKRRVEKRNWSGNYEEMKEKLGRKGWKTRGKTRGKREVNTSRNHCQT
jgi:hypothetical protein